MGEGFLRRKGNLNTSFIGKYSYTGDSIYSIDDNGWTLKLLTSGTLTINKKCKIDIFCVGGGGGSGYVNEARSGGGGGGYTTTEKDKLIASGDYSIIIGAGGAAWTDGEASSAFGVSADGGHCGNGASGGAGGSGGGAVNSPGGSNGENGHANSYYSLKGGAGQGDPTRAFGESTGELYSGGGGGGNGASYGEGGYGGDGGGADGGSDAAANTGGGGGGRQGSDSGHSGGSGIVIIRNARKESAGE